MQVEEEEEEAALQYALHLSTSSGELLANHYAKWFPRARRVEAAPHRAPTPPKGGREGNALPSRARQSTRKRPSRLDVRGPQPLPRTPGPDYPPERRVSVPGP